MLSILINKAVEGGFLSSYKLRDKGRNEVQVSHLLFVEMIPWFFVRILEIRSCILVGFCFGLKRSLG